MEPVPQPGAAHVNHALGLDLCGLVLDGRYQIIKRIGAGGMASVYEARRVGLERRFAVKILRPELAENESNVRRFLREARAAASIQHDNIVNIEDVGNATVPVYFVMEYLEGVDLRQELKRVRRFEWQRAQDLTLQIVDALAAAHQSGIVHRDVKPANCFLVRDPSGTERIKVLDFGIAKVLEESQEFTQSVTATHGIVGTVAYMAPEQARSGTVDARTDVYALGTMLYEMLAGTVPFPDKNPFVVIGRLLGELPVPLRMHRPDLPPDLEAMVMTCLEKDPDARFQSMEALGNAISACHPEGVVGTARVRLPSGLVRAAAIRPAASSSAASSAAASTGAGTGPGRTAPLLSAAVSGSASSGPSNSRSNATIGSSPGISRVDQESESSAALRRRAPASSHDTMLLGVLVGGLGLLALGGTGTWWALRARDDEAASRSVVTPTSDETPASIDPPSTSDATPTTPQSVVQPVLVPVFGTPDTVAITPVAELPIETETPIPPTPTTPTGKRKPPRGGQDPDPSSSSTTTTPTTPSTMPSTSSEPPSKPGPDISPDLRNPFGTGKKK